MLVGLYGHRRFYRTVNIKIVEVPGSEDVWRGSRVADRLHREEDLDGRAFRAVDDVAQELSLARFHFAQDLSKLGDVCRAKIGLAGFAVVARYVNRRRRGIGYTRHRVGRLGGAFRDALWQLTATIAYARAGATGASPFILLPALSPVIG